MILSTLFCHAAAMWPAHWVRSVMTLINAEVRWTFLRGTIWHQKLALIVAPFIDTGRPYDSLGELTWRDWRPSYGGALPLSVRGSQ